MSSVRELLEHAAPGAPVVPLPAAEVRRLGDRRRRRSTALGATIAVGAVAAAAFVGVRAVDGATSRTPPVSGPVTSATPTPVGPTRAVTALEGTRWIPDLVMLKATTTQAYPHEKGNLPRALLTFGRDGRLVLDVLLPGRTPVSIVGSWSATTPASASGELTPALRATVNLDLTAPDAAPPEIAALVAKLDLAVTAEGFLPDGAPAYLEPFSLFLYGGAHTTVYGAIDLVQPDAVLPSPYPSRP